MFTSSLQLSTFQLTYEFALSFAALLHEGFCAYKEKAGGRIGTTTRPVNVSNNVSK